MGTRLRKLKQSGLKCSDGKSLSGKGRLTDKVIDKLTVYYGNAIRQHQNNFAEMRKAVWAVYYHTRSCDAEPLHSFCPPGPNSWCKFQNALFEGTEKNYKHKITISSSVMDAIKPVFNDLSHPKLLSKCLGGKTQNTNESFNSLVWKICPKTLGAGKLIAEIATNEATLLYNDGNVGRQSIMEEFGLTVGQNAKECLAELDVQRVATAERRIQASTKEARQLKRRKQKSNHENLISKEGPSYAAGEF